MKIGPKDFSKAEIHDMAMQLIAETGQPPNLIRQRLAAQGLHWQIPYVRHDNFRARTRRLKAMGMNICLSCGNGKRIGAPACDTCLAKKWGPDEPLVSGSIVLP